MSQLPGRPRSTLHRHRSRSTRNTVSRLRFLPTSAATPLSIPARQAPLLPSAATTTKRWSVKSGTCEQVPKSAQFQASLSPFRGALSPDGHYYAAIDTSCQKIVLFDVTKEKPLGETPSSGDALPPLLCFADPDRLIAFRRNQPIAGLESPLRQDGAIDRLAEILEAGIDCHQPRRQLPDNSFQQTGVSAGNTASL